MTNIFERLSGPDLLPAMAAVQRHPRKFIHFTDIAKLGINPKKRHGDPFGVYFYPNRWLISKQDDINWESQYAVTNKYYFVCDIKKSPNSVNLGTMTLDEARAIADRNGWGTEFQEALNDPSRFDTGPMKKNAIKLPGGKWYAAMDYIVNVAKTHSWPRLLRGVDALIDPGKGIVNQAEPAQVIVMNPAIIKIVETGTNAPPYRSYAAQAVARAAEKLGGTTMWKNGFPGLRVTVGPQKAPVEVLYGPINTPHGKQGDDHGTVSVSFFQLGMWVTRWFDHSPGAYGVDEIERLIVSSVASVSGKAEPEGVVPAWTRDHVRRFMQAFFVTTRFAPAAEAAPGGRVVYSINPDLTRLVPISFRITVMASGSVTIDAKAMIVLKYQTLDSFERTYEFDAAPDPEKVAARILADFKTLLRSSSLFDPKGPDDDIEKRWGILVKASNMRMSA